MLANRATDLMRLLRGDAATGDAELLARFAASRDEAAFAELVRRHGPLVLGVCRRVAGQIQDAEDSFQAVFLVLARKAGTLKQPERLPAFLYGVAFRIARRAKRSAVRRRRREVPVPAMPEPAMIPSNTHADVWPVLDREVTALPEWYRLPLLLCDFDGASRADAARRLGIPEGTLSSRLNAGRKKLAARLTARGITLAVFTAVTPDLANATVSAALVDHATRTASGQAVSPSVATLALYGSGPMRWKLLTMLTVLATGATTAGMVWAMQSPGDAKPEEPKKPAADVAKAPEEPAAKVPGKAVMLDYRDIDGMAGQIFWSPTGREFTVSMRISRGRDSQDLKLYRYVLPNDPKAERTFYEPADIGTDTAPIGYRPDGTTFLYAVQETGYVSGRNHLYTLDWKQDQLRMLRAIDSPALQGNVLAFDGKSALVKTYAKSDDAEESRFRFFDTNFGTLGPVMVTIPARNSDAAAATDGRRLATVAIDATLKKANLAMWDADGKQLWVSESDVTSREPTRTGDYPHQLQISGDGRRVALRTGLRFARVLDGRDGKESVKLERNGDIVGLHCFSADGRLLAGEVATFTEVEPERTPSGKLVERPGKAGAEAKNYTVSNHVIAIWDTSTGKILKTWDIGSRTLLLRFAPDRPMLVVAEYKRPYPVSRLNAGQPAAPNAEVPKTRLGLWDLSGLVP